MKTVAIFLAFLVGFLFCLKYTHNDLVEGMGGQFSCPNLLIKRGNEIHLINKKKAIIPGVNPIRFENLEQYGDYVQWQRRMGIRCPVLFFEETYNTQNEPKWQYSPDPFNLGGDNPPRDIMRGAGNVQVGQLLDANLDTNPPFNQKHFAGYDPDNQNIGKYTPLDKIFHSSSEFSNNPMDANWNPQRAT